MKTPAPNKRLRLMWWTMLYRVSVTAELSHAYELAACRHCGISAEELDRSKRDFPKQWDNLLAKRQRRRAFFDYYGRVPDGWTPPDPKDPRSSNYPHVALVARCRGNEQRTLLYLTEIGFRNECERQAQALNGVLHPTG